LKYGKERKQKVTKKEDPINGRREIVWRNLLEKLGSASCKKKVSTFNADEHGIVEDASKVIPA
jgi:hypothetical protein